MALQKIPEANSTPIGLNPRYVSFDGIDLKQQKIYKESKPTITIKMVLKILRISEVIGMKIFTDGGDFIGTIEEANLIDNKVDSWKVRIARDSSIAPMLSGARGLIIPHQYVKAFGEVVLISKVAIPESEIKEEAVE